MFSVFKWFLFVNFVIVFVQCTISGLAVKKLDKKVIDKKRQDNLELCKKFNEEEKIKGKTKIHGNLAKPFLYENKVVKKKDLGGGPKVKPNLSRKARIKRAKREVNEIEDVNPQRMKREIGKSAAGFEVRVEPATTSRLNLADQQRVEKLVGKLYDDMSENKGKRVKYRRKILNTSFSVPPQGGRKKMFYFAPHLIEPAKADKEDGLRIPDGPRIDWPKVWPHGIIPYFIDPKTYDSVLATKITNAFDYFEKATCIRLQRLREKPTDSKSLKHIEWIYITNPSGIRQCVHSNERKPNIGVQVVVFGYDCMSLGEIAHEVMHTLGFSHEHTRPDRDRYITIMWDNIKPGYRKYFEARVDDPLYNLPYDYASVLHYPPRAFSRNGQLTILADGGIKIGQREGISETDVEKVSMIFGNDCMKRNRDYLLTTCPSVIKNKDVPTEVPTKDDIDKYFRDRIWPYGVVHYRFKDMMEFSSDERENINSVMQHIEAETCIQFKDMSGDNGNEEQVNDYQEAEPKPVLPDGLKDDKKVEGNTDNTGADNNMNNIDMAYVDKLHVRPTLPNAENLRAKRAATLGLSPIGTAATNKTNNDLHTNAKPREVEFLVRTNSGNKENEKEAARTSVRKTRSNNILRQVSNSLVLTRTARPGCVCPPSGKSNGETVLELSSDCFNSVNDLLHVFVHVLGLDHQHNTHDRDSFIHIVWSNLTEEIKQDLQQKLPPAASAGFPYDYQSVMHFPWLQIKDGVTNLMYPIWNDGWAMGHWQGLSSTDVQKLNLIYFDECLNRKNEEA